MCRQKNNSCKESLVHRTEHKLFLKEKDRDLSIGEKLNNLVTGLNKDLPHVVDFLEQEHDRLLNSFFF